MGVIFYRNFLVLIVPCRVLLILFLVSCSYSGYAQEPAPIVLLKKGLVTYGTAFHEMKSQLHLNVSFIPGALDTTETFHSRGWMTVEGILDLLRKKHLAVSWLDATSIYLRKINIPPSDPTHRVRPGVRTIIQRITDEFDKPVPFATVKNNNTGEATVADSNGTATLSVRQRANLTVSCVGREPVTRNVTGEMEQHFVLIVKPDLLQEATVGYGKGNRATTTAGYFTFSSQAISGGSFMPGFQGISNGTPQTMLEGWIPGVLVRQTSGVVGASASLTVQGPSSIFNSSDPLYVVDGVPYSANNWSMSNILTGNSAGSLSPLSFIPVSDIQRIDVLKDADATSIYGSRGANGVVLITTRHWKPGSPRWSIQTSAGFSEVTRRPALMNIHEYLAMRREALRNDRLPDTPYAPDISVLDTTRSIDWQHRIIGGIAPIQNIQVSLSGANRNTNYFTGTSYLRETNVFPSKPSHERAGLHFNVTHHSSDRRLFLQTSGMAATDRNHQFISIDPTILQLTAPNAPEPLDRQGYLYFADSTIPWTNPLSWFRQTYEAVSHDLLANVTGSYQLSPSLTIKGTVGGNDVGTREYGQIPIAAQDPSTNPSGTAYFSHTWYNSRILEPQMEYRRKVGKFRFSWLGGATWQWQQGNMNTQNYTGYTNDAWLRQAGKGIPGDADTGHLASRYTALFTRINGNWDDKYILNFTGRRDGSDRWGPHEQFGNFGAIGGAWIFSKERLTKRLLRILSFGKLRGSYGISGNDQVGNYVVQNTSATAIPAFQAIRGFYQTGHIVQGKGWETTSKMTYSVDLGFLDDRLLFNLTWYRHRSANQLIADPNNTPLSINTVPAVLENKGWEFSSSFRMIETADLGWTVSLNWSLPVNKLVSWPGLGTSSFANELFIGQSLNAIKGYVYTGVDKQKGLFTFADLNRDGKITDKDQKVIGKFDVTGFGGLYNSMRWKRFQLELLIDVRLQTGVNPLETMYQNNPPGSIRAGLTSNYTTALLRRWQGKGDNAQYQLLTTGANLAADTAIGRYLSSSAMVTDASFVRLRKLSLTYGFSPKLLAKLHLSSATLFITGQNLISLSPYKDADPEIQNIQIVPTLRTIEGGFRVAF